MSETLCKICNSKTKHLFNAKVLRKYDVDYFECISCGFVQTESVYWLKEAYENSMNLSDTGIAVRNLRLSRIATTILFLFFGTKKRYLDYAGGYGLFTRLMRDIGFDFYWSDPFTPNLLARGFEDKTNEKFTLATSFESFEHFDNPKEEVKKILLKADNILISTELLPAPTPKITDWWYYAPEHGQHIAFYTKRTFQLLAQQSNMHYYNADNIHLLANKPMSFFARGLFYIPGIKYLFYLFSYPISWKMRSKTKADMEQLKGGQEI